MFKTNITNNPYRNGSFKFRLFAWALTQETFTKEQFLAKVIELKNEHNIVSKMSDEVLAKAWFSEFKNKHKVFELSN